MKKEYSWERKSICEAMWDQRERGACKKLKEVRNGWNVE